MPDPARVPRTQRMAGEPGSLAGALKGAKKNVASNPGWSYTNVGEAEADIVVREAMQRMSEEAAREAAEVL